MVGYMACAATPCGDLGLPLAESIAPVHRVVSIIPRSGIQFLDYGFSLVLPDGKRNDRAPRDWSFIDSTRAPQHVPMLLLRGEANVAGVPGKEDYSVGLKELLQFASRTWLPLPLLREEPGNRFFEGPINWARVYIVPLEDRDAGKHDHRIVIALDTNLMEDHPSTAYLAPCPEDAKNGRKFSLPTRPEHLSFFLQQKWLRDWLEETFHLMLEAEQRRLSGRREVSLSDEEVADLRQGPHEAVARYMALLDLLNELDFLPKIELVDTETVAKQVHVDVEMVLDLGNSRTCGLLVEAEPDSRGVDIKSAFKLELRDLSRPECVYSDPFDSRLEFALAQFGSEQHSSHSGRSDAFSWPTIVRVGPEAVWLAGRRRGSDGRTGMSSPKRYLWDKAPAQQPWRFNGVTPDGDQDGVAAQGAFAMLVNDSGRPLHIPDPDGIEDDQLPSMLARYSRSSLVTFALAEIFLQALVMMNAPAQRLRRRNAALRRRLRRLILTMPTALSLAERRILLERAEAARDLVYLCLGWVSRVQGAPGLDWGDELKPEIDLRWDEASATQVVYLYSQIALNFSGDACAFMRTIRSGGQAARTAAQMERPENTMSVGTIDIGGGTTDLVITSLTAEGQGAHVTLFPRQDFRESFSLAGDDIVQALSREIVVTALRQAIEAVVGRRRAEVVVQDLFGGNRGDMTAEAELRRAQF
ncbi:MAG: virulence factor SrfB, partial [Janthinobacterium lividum]